MTTPQQPEYADRSYRSPQGIVGGLLLLGFAAWIGGDALATGDGRVPWIAAAALLLVVPLIVAFTFRPVVYAGADRLRVRNPFRTVDLPWAAVADVRAGYSSEVITQDGTIYQLWSVPVSLRERKKAARRRDRAGDDTQEVRAAGADRTIAELRELAERGASRPTAQGAPRVRWAYEVIAPALAGLVLLVVLLVV
ncbi:PH domain-containing protein [Streptomyces sp. WAC05374]|uniref:PH domain-containing protein n=1 Tax=Streptomyces sp. WAC05374 TaxID=2487420 RepID=UPI000F87F455|nr:PH domain-containing protein [Streptomyces sp. WAC05374]RST09101.1 PH domain-containing protein [Streptomyces sp. WAC05374]TDF43167.1 PH domain-containing protein [Streptomyces sp. WAC05374]TDF50953.1 PH domain-containing protein [Streptomyces sp. WAC05374]TDF52304.1 PH domain-containing protein [Streptomyces sp. WAC05374]